MKVVERFTTLFFALALGYIVLYVFGLVMGVFSPGQLIGFSAVAVVLAVAYLVHAVRVRRAMRTPGHHEEIMRGLHAYRERRGF